MKPTTSQVTKVAILSLQQKGNESIPSDRPADASSARSLASMHAGVSKAWEEHEAGTPRSQRFVRRNFENLSLPRAPSPMKSKQTRREQTTAIRTSVKQNAVLLEKTPSPKKRGQFEQELSIITTPIKQNSVLSNASEVELRPMGKVSYALFERIVVLYPESVYSLLRSDQIPTPRKKLTSNDTPEPFSLEGTPDGRKSCVRIASFSKIDKTTGLRTPQKTVFIVEDDDMERTSMDSHFDNLDVLPFSQAKRFFTREEDDECINVPQNDKLISPLGTIQDDVNQVEVENARRSPDIARLEKKITSTPEATTIVAVVDEDKHDGHSKDVNQGSEHYMLLKDEGLMEQRKSSSSSLYARDGSTENSFELTDEYLMKHAEETVRAAKQNEGPWNTDLNHEIKELFKSSPSQSSSNESFAEEDESQIYSFSKDSMQNVSYGEGIHGLFDGDDELVGSMAVRKVTTMDADEIRVLLAESSPGSSRFGDADDEALPISNQQAHSRMDSSAVRRLFSASEDDEGYNVANRDDAPKTVLRRSIASRRRSFVDIPVMPLANREHIGGDQNEYGIEMKEEEAPEITSVDSFPLESQFSGRPKGIVMRTFSCDKAKRSGNRRAETGVILSHAEMSIASAAVEFSADPNPKSFHPGAFQNGNSVSTYDADVFSSCAAKRGLFDDEYCDHNDDDEGDANAGNRRGSDSLSSLKVADRVMNGKHDVCSGRQRQLRSATRDSSSRGIRRMSHSIRRASDALRRRSRNNVPEAARTELLIDGTSRDTIRRISSICSEKLQLDVYLKDTGKKIRVESREGGGGDYLRASVLVTQHYGPTISCAVKIRQSRSDGMKTSFGALWKFYTSLREELDLLEQQDQSGWVRE